LKISHFRGFFILKKYISFLRFVQFLYSFGDFSQNALSYFY